MLRTALAALASLLLLAFAPAGIAQAPVTKVAEIEGVTEYRLDNGACCWCRTPPWTR